MPWAQGKLFDAAIDAAVAHRIQQRTETLDEAFAALLPWLGAVGGFYAASWVFEVAVGILFALFAHTAVTRLRSRMFLNLIQQDIGFYDDHNSGELSSRLINDSGQLNAFAQFTSQALLKALVQLCGSLPAMFASHWQLALLATVISPLNWLIVRRAGVVQGMYGIVQQETMARANGAAVEALGAMRTVQANTGELGEWRRFALRICHFLRVVLVTVHAQTMVIFSQMGLAKVRDVAVLALGMRMVLQNAMDPSQGLTIGGFVAFNMYVSLYEQGFSALANMYMSLAETLISIGRFLQLLEREPGDRLRRRRRAANLPRRRRAARRLLPLPARARRAGAQGISFVATPGTVVALVGESGAGKSTVGRLLERFYDPQGGAPPRRRRLPQARAALAPPADRRLVEQEPVRGCDARLEHKVGRRLVLSLPSPLLLPATGALRHDDRREHRVRQAGGAARRRPRRRAPRQRRGLHPADGRRVRRAGAMTEGVRISGGQKQRVATARGAQGPEASLDEDVRARLERGGRQAARQSDAGEDDRRVAHRLSTVVAPPRSSSSTRASLSSATSSSAPAPDSKYAYFMHTSWSARIRKQEVRMLGAGRCDEAARVAIVASRSSRTAKLLLRSTERDVRARLGPPTGASSKRALDNRQDRSGTSHRHPSLIARPPLGRTASSRAITAMIIVLGDGDRRVRRASSAAPAPDSAPTGARTFAAQPALGTRGATARVQRRLHGLWTSSSARGVRN